MTAERFHAPLDPLIASLLHLVPRAGTAWHAVDRRHWLEAFGAAIETAYPMATLTTTLRSHRVEDAVTMELEFAFLAKTAEIKNGLINAEQIGRGQHSSSAEPPIRISEVVAGSFRFSDADADGQARPVEVQLIDADGHLQQTLVEGVLKFPNAVKLIDPRHPFAFPVHMELPDFGRYELLLRVGDTIVKRFPIHVVPAP